MIKQLMPMVANSTAFEKFVALLEHSGGERANLLRVLTYHRVDEPDAHPWLDPGLISASPQAFEMQMKYLAANYQPISALDVIKAFEMKGQNTLPPRAVMVTFDDAYCDFEKHAWPILKQYQIPATLFVPTAFPDHPERTFWWDRLFNAIHTTVIGELNTSSERLTISTALQRNQAYKSIKNFLKTLPHDKAIADVDRICSELDVPPHDNDILSWDSLRQLVSEGLTLGAHTQNHPIMNCITPDELQKEVIGSLHDLQREIGLVPLTFAYPSGIYNKEAVKTVERAGFKLAFTTERGINEVSHADRLRLQRINVSPRTTLPVLRAQLLSWSAPLYSLSNKFLS
jgi:peptidoglycan/xylan/chitin deacetylase (PgdA/CDA1 family)